MRRIIHISDVHFGRCDERVLEALFRACTHLQPHLSIISGDLTQHARTSEFAEAEAFLKKMRKNTISIFAIPGNHDVERTPITRMLQPYKTYRKHIAATTEPTYADQEIALVGINTVRAAQFRNGRISKTQVQVAKQWLSKFPKHLTKIIVTHHPLVLPKEYRTLRHAHRRMWLARGASSATDPLASSGVDLFLSGHYHLSSIVRTAECYSDNRYGAIAAQAGTISERKRGEAQSFNLLTVEKPLITVDTYRLNLANEFVRAATKKFVRIEHRWHALPVQALSPTLSVYSV